MASIGTNCFRSYSNHSDNVRISFDLRYNPIGQPTGRGYFPGFVARSRPIIDAERPDHVVFSYHGLPERQVKKCDPSKRHCLASNDCCAQLSSVNQNCYRAQCHDTSRSLAATLGLRDGESSTCFQSRLGRTPWIRPYTDEVISSLLAQGKKRLVVVCPAFVADCLETIEEIGMRAKADFLARGGESLTLIPSLNSDADWADAICAMVASPSSTKTSASVDHPGIDTARILREEPSTHKATSGIHPIYVTQDAYVVKMFP